MSAISGTCSATAWAGNSRNATSAGGYTDPTIAGLYNELHSGDQTRTQGLQLMQQTLQDLAEHKITPAQMLKVYDQLKAIGVDGPEMDKLDQMFNEATLPRDKIEAAGLGALDKHTVTADNRWRTLGQSVIEARDMLIQAASARSSGGSMGNTAAGYTGNDRNAGPLYF